LYLWQDDANDLHMVLNDSMSFNISFLFLHLLVLLQTSIVFTLEEGPGVLFKALAVFALRSINLTKIESRPQRKRPLRVVDDNNNGTSRYFDYLFYVDFEASMADQRSQNALRHLQEFATFLRVLGSYPMDVSPMRA
jgi:arogenate/prephenate dehydratase